MFKGFSSLGGLRSLNDRQRRRKPQRWYLLLGLLGVLCVSALGYTSTNISKSARNMNPCDLFGGKVCPDSMFSQAPPARPLSDDELATRVLVQEILSEPPKSAVKAKIAFMFLTAGPLPFERLWEKFFEVCHASFTLHFSHVEPSFVPTQTPCEVDGLGAGFGLIF